MMQIYLDYSATTPTRKEAIAMMQKVFNTDWGNPSSLHQWGERSALIMEVARIQVASLINANYENIVFTSGGTEADNLAIMGVARCYDQPQHIIISTVEHSAINQPINLLETWGWKISRLPVDQWGRVNPDDLENAIENNTVLISIIYGQSEIGTLQPIEKLSEIARSHGILFHTDAVQVAGRLPIDVQDLPIDLLSLSSHKIYGVQGAGALYIKSGIKIAPLLLGGGQELNLRSGTQPVPIIAAFGVAADLAKQEMTAESERLIKLRDRLFHLLADCSDFIPTGHPEYRLPHHVSFVINPQTKITGREMVRQMNLAGIGISSGAACNSGKIQPSAVLLALGMNEDQAQGGIRLTLGKDTTEADINWTATVLKQIIDLH
jgi:cysteine desulfurase